MNHRRLKNFLFLQLSSFSIAAVQSQTLTVRYPKQKRIRTQTPILKLQTGNNNNLIIIIMVVYALTYGTPRDVYHDMVYT